MQVLFLLRRYKNDVYGLSKKTYNIRQNNRPFSWSLVFVHQNDYWTSLAYVDRYLRQAGRRLVRWLV